MDFIVAMKSAPNFPKLDDLFNLCSDESDNPYIVHLNFIQKWIVETTHCHMVVIWLSHVHCSTMGLLEALTYHTFLESNYL